MKVRATFANGKFGFYGGLRRRDGDVFTLEDESHFSSKWMSKIDSDPDVDAEKKPRRGRKPAELQSEEVQDGAE